MPTVISFADVIARVDQQLLGYTKDQMSISYLAQPLDDVATTFFADPETVTNISRGLIEINSEMMLVKKFDRTTGIVTLFPNGRGRSGTSPAFHATGDFITNDPRFPRWRIKEAINDTIRGIYPDIFVFGSHEFNWTAARYEYPLPVEVEDVYRVTVNTIGPSKVWFPATSWRFNPQAATSGPQAPVGATGKSLQLMRDFVVPGRAVRVVYTKKPNILDAETDVFTTVTGLEDRMVDLIVYGACWRLIPAYEAARLQQTSVEATERSQVVPAGAASQAAQMYQRLYMQRLQEERDRLLKLFPTFQTWNA